MSKPLVGIVLGSRADFNIMRRGLESLRVMGVPYIFEMASSHRTPERLLKFAQGAQEMGLEVLICAAGGSAQIAGMIASVTILPVIAVPIDSTPLRGEDALLSMVQQPPGTPVATVGINNGENAALLATQILSIKFPNYRTVLTHNRQQVALKVESAHKDLMAEYPDLVDPKKTAPYYLKPAAIDDDTDSGDEAEEPKENKAPAESENETHDELNPIRPGASLEFRGGKATPRSLISTPLPQEPERTSNGDGVPKPDSGDAFALPALSDITPLPSIFGSLTESITPAPVMRPGIQTPTPTPVSRRSTSAEQEEENLLAQLERVLKETKVFTLEHNEADEDVLSHAMMVLLEGGVVAFPTDTVYGLAADATNAAAVRNLYEVKGQEAQRKSLSVLVHNADMLNLLVKEVPAAVENVMDKLWPGALTILFYKQPAVLADVSDVPSIAIRIPRDPVALKILEMVNRPLVVINAAYQDAPAATEAHAVLDRFDGKIDCILDAGPCTGAQTSTVLSVLAEPFEILREGAVTAEDIQSILGDKLKKKG
ncbi:threonylcarbamoyl-AMP synthase [Candidatus Sumerlaeota bacterium]|nr:threonylcarbamoyl-AMP synthase [Candidatus Sumerlaeota bacterium]